MSKIHGYLRAKIPTGHLRRHNIKDNDGGWARGLERTRQRTRNDNSTNDESLLLNGVEEAQATVRSRTKSGGISVLRVPGARRFCTPRIDLDHRLTTLDNSARSPREGSHLRLNPTHPQSRSRGKVL